MALLHQAVAASAVAAASSRRREWVVSLNMSSPGSVDRSVVADERRAVSPKASRRCRVVAPGYDAAMLWLDLLLATAALAVALALKPWRAVAGSAPPWPALAWWALMPLLWSADRLSAIPVLQPLAGSCLLMLMLGWPLAVLMLVPVAAMTWLLGGLAPAEALDRFVWLGVVPVTLAMLIGAALRRWLPHHLFIYILGRGFFATALAVAAAGAVASLLQTAPVGLSGGDLLLARWLFAWGDAFITGMLVAIFVAFRPQWLATYADRIYLPRG
jgi:uncharacterized membrane protein